MAGQIEDPGYSNAHAGRLKVVENRYDPAPIPPRFAEPMEPEQDIIDIRALAQVLLKRKFVILSLLLVGLTIGYLSTLLVEPRYRAQSTIEIAKQATQVLSDASIEPQIQADSEFVQTQSALLKSRELAQRVVEQLGLDSNPNYADQELEPQQRVQAATQTLLRNLSVNVEGASRLISVKAASLDPEDAARVTNTLVENFIQTSLERKYNTTAYARRFVEDRLKAARTSLEDSEADLADYAAREGLVDFGEGSTVFSLDGSTLLTLNQELATSQSDRITAYQKYLEAKSSPMNIDALESPALKSLREQRFTLEADYQNKLAVYRPEFPEMQKLKQRIELTDTEIEAERSRIITALEASYKAAAAKEESLKERINELKLELIDLRNRNVQYGILDRQVETNRSQYEALLTRLKELTTAEGISASQASIVDRAIAPNHPFEPNLPRHLMLGAFVCVALGVGLAFVIEFLDDTIRIPEQLLSKLGLPVIGIVPVANKKAQLVEHMLQNPRDPLAEGFFSIRANLQFSSNKGAPHALALTSTLQGEGKSTCAIGLALAFARSGDKVLVVDADMRRPSFAVDRDLSIGLSGLLASQAPLTEQIVHGPNDNLYLLPAGRIPPNPAELLSGPKLFHLLAECRTMFDVVIVDCPPVLGFADAPLIAAACDGTAIIVSSGAARRMTIMRSLDRVKSSGTRTVGAVLTKFDARKVGYDYNYYYYTYGPGAYDYSRAEVKAERKSRKIEVFHDAANGS